MTYKKLKIPTSMLVLCSLATTSFAFEDSRSEQDQNTPALSSSAQPFSSLPGSISQISTGQGWLNDKWQGQSSLYRSTSLDTGLHEPGQWSVDITRRLLSVKPNTYLAMGLGWNDIEMTAGDSSFGMRFVAEGRVGLYGPAYIFGQAALSPWMTNDGHLVDPFGKALELGLAVDPLPSMSLRAGYRGYWLDSTKTSPDSSLRSQTDGFFVGGGLRW